MDDFWAWLAIAATIIFFVGLVGMTSVMVTPSYPPMDIPDDPDVPEHIKDVFREDTREKGHG